MKIAKAFLNILKTIIECLKAAFSKEGGLK